MNAIGLAAYIAAVVLLFLKFVVVVSAQGRLRSRTGIFRHPEDARRYGGTATTPESDPVERLQRMLANDGEGQPYFFVLGALYLASSAWPPGAPLYFLGYAATRIAHATWFVVPRQPHRTASFGAGLLVLMAMTGHVVWATVELPRS